MVKVPLQYALVKLCAITHFLNCSLLSLVKCLHHRESMPNAVVNAKLKDGCVRLRDASICISEAVCTVSVSEAGNITCCGKIN